MRRCAIVRRAFRLVLTLLFTMAPAGRAQADGVEVRILRYAVEQLCREPEVSTLAPSTCEAAPELESRDELRSRLLSDIAQRLARDVGPAARRRLLLVLAVVAPESLFESVNALGGPSLFCRGDCEPDDEATSSVLEILYTSPSADPSAAADLLRSKYGDCPGIERSRELVAHALRVRTEGVTSRSSLSLFAEVSGQPPPRAAEILAALDETHDVRSLRAIVRTSKLLLPPWTDAWEVDANLTAFGLAKNLHDLGGDVARGYAGSLFGGDLRAALSSYRYSANGLVANRRGSLEVEGWHFFEVSTRLSIEARATAGLTFDDVALRNAGTGVLFAKEEEHTRAVRGDVAGGLRWHPGARFVATLGGAVGARYEHYELERFNFIGSATPRQSSSTLLVGGRARAQLAVIPGSLSARAKLDVSGYHTSLGRNETLYFDGLVSTSSSTALSYAVELSSRVALDLDLLTIELVHLSPSIHAGLDALWLDTPNGTSASTVPVAGVGLRRESF